MKSPIVSRIIGIIFLIIGVVGLIYSITQGRIAYGIVGCLIFVYLGYKYLQQAKERAAGVEQPEDIIRRRRDLPAAIDPNEIITTPFTSKKTENTQPEPAEEKSTSAETVQESAKTSAEQEVHHE